MRSLLRLAPALLAAGALQGQAPDPSDPLLASLVREALAASPQLKAAQAARDVEQTKVPQAGALPDPMVTLGYQNDGFRKLTYGESSFAFGQVGVSQSFPYPGKRRLRGQIAEAGVAAADAAVDRVKLDLVAAVKRAYFDLLRVRGQRTLLDAQGILWVQAAAVARAKVEAGTGDTTDLLRAQLEQTRLAQQSAGLEGREAALISELDRLSGRTPGQPVEASGALDALPLPPSPGAGQASEQVIAASPELAEAHHHLQHYEQQVELAKLDLRPDFTLGATYMPQGSMPGMWSVSVGFNVPLWSGRKQRQAMAGARAEAEMQDQRIADLHQRLEAVTHARVARLEADLKIVHLYQEGLLAQSDAAYKLSLTQFATGSTGFRAVLEALSARLKDRSDYLDSLAEAHFDAIELERAAPDAATQLGPQPEPMNGGTQ